MAQFTQDGVIYEELPDGNVRVVGYADAPQGGQPAPMTFGNPKPKEAPSGYRWGPNGELIAIPGGPADKPTDDPNAPKLPTGYRWRPDGTAERIPGTEGAEGQGGEARMQRDQRLANMAALQEQLGRVRELYAQGPGATQGIAGLLDFLPTARNRQFDAAAAGLGDIGNAAFKVPGMGAQSDADAARFVAANQPQASDYDSQIAEKLRTIQQRLDAAYKEMGVPAGQAQPAQQQLATGDTRREVDPVASGIIDRMIRQGKSADEINAVLGPLGFNPVGPGDVAAAQDYLRKNPNYDKSVGRAERVLPIENPTLNAALQTAPGTAAATYLNAGGFGVPQALNPQAFEALRDKNPMSAFAGDVGGIITATSGIGAVGNSLARSLAPRALTGGGRWGNAARAVAPDAAYGAAYGGITEGDPLTGAATATLGSAGGQLLGKGIQKTFQGVSDPAVQYLTERGIPLTIGQTLGNRGVIGRTVNKMESIPVLGDMLARNRMDGLQAFEREALNDVVSPIGGRVTTGGAEGLQQAQGAVSQAYGDALSGVNVSPDAQFISDAQAAMQAGAAVPKFGEDFTYMMNQEVGPVFGQGGQLSGPQLQSALQSLGKMRSGFAKNPDAMAGYAADATSQMDDALTGLVSRQSPDTMPAYNAAKGAFQRLAPFENARISGVNQEAITPAQLARSITNNTKNFGGRAAAARGDNLTDLIRYGQEVLPSTVPNSGTADRLAGMSGLLLPTALGGTSYAVSDMSPSTAAGLAALAALSTKTGQKAAQAALTKRPKAIKRLGGIFGRRKAQKGLAGMVTAPLLIED